MIQFNGKQIKDVMFGSTQVIKVYQGSTLIYSLTPAGGLAPIPEWESQNMDITDGINFVPNSGDARAWSSWHIPVGGVGEIRGRSHVTIFGLDNLDGSIPYTDIDFCVWRSPSGKVGTYNNNFGFEGDDVPEDTIERVRLDGTQIHFEYSTDEGSTWTDIQPPEAQPAIKLYPKISTDPGEYVTDVLGEGFVHDGTTPDMKTVTIVIAGIPSNAEIKVNGEVWVNGTKSFPLNIQLNNMVVSVDGYIITPSSFTVTVDDNKVINFTAEIAPDLPDGHILVGTGTGYLSFSQASTGAVAGNTILIKNGSYRGIYISDFNLAAGETIYVKNYGEVVITEGMELINTAGLVVSGDYVPDIAQGFKFLNINGRAIKMKTRYSRVTLQDMLFKNVTDYCIASESDINNKQYDGTEATRSEDLKFLNLEFDNAGAIQWGGDLDSVQGNDKCYTVGFEVANCWWHGMADVGSCIWFGNVNGYNIHHNKFENLNTTNNNHNGLTLATGSGKYHNNYCHETQGDAIRAWGFSRGTETQKVQIYNNICTRSRKYSAFEFQAFDKYIIPGVTCPAEFECFSNTVHMMHYEDNSGTPAGNYHGVILDTYGVAGGVTNAWNNVGINFMYPANVQGGGNYLWGNGDPDNVYPNTNRYYATLAAAGLSEDNLFVPLLGSPLAGGDYRTDPYPIDDYYGNPRVGTPTIGAVQTNN